MEEALLNCACKHCGASMHDQVSVQSTSQPTCKTSAPPQMSSETKRSSMSDASARFSRLRKFSAHRGRLRNSVLVVSLKTEVAGHSKTNHIHARIQHTPGFTRFTRFDMSFLIINHTETLLESLKAPLCNKGHP